MKKWWSGVSGFIRSERSSAACSFARRNVVHELVNCRLEVVLHRLERRREVVVGLEVAADSLDDRRRALPPGRVDELVRPDRLVPELELVGPKPLGDETPSTL
jgi:hypothetical protein